MAGYWIVRASAIRDEAALQDYGKLWGPVAERFGAEIIAGKAAVDTREGAEYPRQLVIRFASYEQAVACYDSPEYQATMEYVHRAYGGERDLAILDGD